MLSAYSVPSQFFAQLRKKTVTWFHPNLTNVIFCGPAILKTNGVRPYPVRRASFERYPPAPHPFRTKRTRAESAACFVKAQGTLALAMLVVLRTQESPTRIHVRASFAPRGNPHARSSVLLLSSGTSVPQTQQGGVGMHSIVAIVASNVAPASG